MYRRWVWLSRCLERRHPVSVVQHKTASSKRTGSHWQRTGRVRHAPSPSSCLLSWLITDLWTRVVYPILIRNLLPSVGFGWTVRAIALIVLVLLGFAVGVVRIPPSSSKRRRRFLDRASLSDWPYVLFVLGCFTVFLGMYTPFFYVQSYAIEGTSTSSDVAFYIVTAMNLASIPGRIIPGLLAQRFQPLSMIIGTGIVLAACGLGLLGAKTTVSVFAVSILYGFFTGSFFALQPTIFVRLTGDMKVLGTRFGMAFTVMSVALLFGSPISGALQDTYGYWASWAWVGATILAGAAIIGVAKVIQGRKIAATKAG